MVIQRKRKNASNSCSRILMTMKKKVKSIRNLLKRIKIKNIKKKTKTMMKTS